MTFRCKGKGSRELLYRESVSVILNLDLGNLGRGKISRLAVFPRKHRHARNDEVDSHDFHRRDVNTWHICMYVRQEKTSPETNIDFFGKFSKKQLRTSK